MVKVCNIFSSQSIYWVISSCSRGGYCCRQYKLRTGITILFSQCGHISGWIRCIRNKVNKEVNWTSLELLQLLRKGRIVFEVTGWSDATGHADLWDGSKCLWKGYEIEDIGSITGGIVEKSSYSPDKFQQVALLVKTYSPSIQSKHSVDVDLLKCFKLEQDPDFIKTVNKLK